MLGLTQVLRYRLASLAISDKQARYAIVYMVGSVFVVLSFAFELRLQTYVILAEVVTNWVGIVLVILETACAIWIIFIFQRKRRDR